MRLSRAGWRAAIAPGRWLFGGRGEIYVDAGIADQGNFLAVMRGDDELATLFGDFEVGRRYRFDGVDRGAQRKGMADLGHRGGAALFLRDRLDDLLHGHEFEVG